MGQADDRAVRRAYLVVLVVPLVLVGTLWILGGTNDRFTRVLYPTIMVAHGLLTAGLLSRRLSTRTVGSLIFLSAMAILVSRLLAWELHLTPRPDDAGIVVVVFAWSGVVSALAFLVFGTKRGTVISLAGYVFMCLGMVLSASGGMVATYGLREVVGAAGAQAALIAVVWVLARNVEQLSAARAMGELLALQATTDPLTGLANRRRLDDELERMIAEAQRCSRPLSAVLVDLDHFKRVNDLFGHDVGDRVLVTIVLRLLTTVRDADLLGRWGGEEFLLLAPHTDYEAACGLAERCRDELARAVTDDLADVAVTASFGVATFGPSEDARALIRRADIALYAAKCGGRDRVVGDRSPLAAISVDEARQRVEHLAG